MLVSNHSAANREQANEAAVKLQLLTPREREVLDGLAKGLPNKSIAYDLGISPRTVEIHRANLMSKLGREKPVRSAAHRVRGRGANSRLRNITDRALELAVRHFRVAQALEVESSR